MTEQELRRHVRGFLATGSHDPMGVVGGGSILDGLRGYEAALRAALVAAVQRRERDRSAPPAHAELDPVAFARERLAPMVDGLFPALERPVVLRLLAESIIFLTPEATHRVLGKVDLSTAWTVANVYLRSLGAKALGPEDHTPVGLSTNMVCYVSVDYFTRQEPCADWVVHEAAHVFHDQRRRYVGLRDTRYRERLLEIDFSKRETFAYGCEFYSHIVAHARSRREREALLSEWRQRGPWGSSQQVDWTELQTIVGEAVTARNGWKRILARCAPPPRRPRREWIEECARQAVSRAEARGAHYQAKRDSLEWAR